jgi:hypothetical protein
MCLVGFVYRLVRLYSGEERAKARKVPKMIATTLEGHLISPLVPSGRFGCLTYECRLAWDRSLNRGAILVV